MSLKSASNEVRESNVENQDKELTIDDYQMLKFDESSGRDKLITYKDSKDKWTVGIGHNIEADDGYKAIGRHLKPGDSITLEEQQKLFEYDTAKVNRGLSKNIEGYEKLPTKYKTVLKNMAFNMGVGGVLEFKKMISAMKRGDDVGVASSIRGSKYYQDVRGKRAERMVAIAEGKIPKEYIATFAATAIGTAAISSKTIASAVSSGISKVGTATSSIVGKVADSVKSVFTSSEEKQEKQETSITVEKPKKKVAYETQGLNNWQKNIIILLTDWVNSKRIINKENKEDTISVAQALNERTETETIKLEREEPQSFAKTFMKGTIVASSMLAIPAIAKTVNFKDTSTKKELIAESQTEDSKKIRISASPLSKKEVSKEIRISASPLPKKVSIKEVSDSENQAVKENFNKPIISAIEKANKPIAKEISTPVKVAFNKPVIQKVFPKQTEQKKTKQRTIIVSETNNTEIEQISPVFLFGDKYSARDEIKSISLSTREFGTGLLHRS